MDIYARFVAQVIVRKGIMLFSKKGCKFKKANYLKLTAFKILIHIKNILKITKSYLIVK